MAISDSNLQPDQIAVARRLLATPARRDRVWPALAAAGALALTALAFATVMILAPPVETEHVATGAPD